MKLFAKDVGDSPASQKASLHTVPNSTSGHKKPGVTPVGDKAMTGGKYK